MLKRIIVFAFIIISLFRLSAMPVYAQGIVQISNFEKLKDAPEKYIGDDYRNNYYLDIEEPGILDTGDKIVNDIANVLFSIIKLFAYLVCAIFYHSMSLSITELLSDIINGVQGLMHENIFAPLFNIAFVCTFFVMAMRFTKRDLMGLLGELVKTLTIIALSLLVVNHSASVLTWTTSLTKYIGVTAMAGFDEKNKYDVNQYATASAATLWTNLVHEPWVSVEFGNESVSSGEIEEILSTSPNCPDRIDLIKHMREGNPDLFPKTAGAGRIGFLFVYLIPFFIKLVIFMLFGVLQLAFQVMALLFVFLAPIILLLALIPAFGGFDLVSHWLKKILEMELNILVITFILGLLVKVDTELFKLSAQIGWFVIAFIQAIIYLTIVLGRKQLFNFFANIQKNIQTPASLKYRLNRSGDMFEAVRKRNIRINNERQKMIAANTRRPVTVGSAVGTDDISNRYGNSYTEVPRPNAMGNDDDTYTDAYNSGYRWANNLLRSRRNTPARGADGYADSYVDGEPVGNERIGDTSSRDIGNSNNRSANGNGDAADFVRESLPVSNNPRAASYREVERPNTIPDRQRPNQQRSTRYTPSTAGQRDTSQRADDTPQDLSRVTQSRPIVPSRMHGQNNPYQEVERPNAMPVTADGNGDNDTRQDTGYSNTSQRHAETAASGPNSNVYVLPYAVGQETVEQPRAVNRASARNATPRAAAVPQGKAPAANRTSSPTPAPVPTSASPRQQTTRTARTTNRASAPHTPNVALPNASRPSAATPGRSNPTPFERPEATPVSKPVTPAQTVAVHPLTASWPPTVTAQPTAAKPSSNSTPKPAAQPTRQGRKSPQRTDRNTAGTNPVNTRVTRQTTTAKAADNANANTAATKRTASRTNAKQ